MENIEKRKKTLFITSLVLTIIAAIGFIVCMYIGISAVVTALNSSNPGVGIGSAILFLYFVIGLIATFIFLIAGMVVGITGLKLQHSKCKLLIIINAAMMTLLLIVFFTYIICNK